MRNCSILLVSLGTIGPYVAPAQQADDRPMVPPSVQGDWIVAPGPSFDPRFKEPVASVRMTSSNYVHRLREADGFNGGWDTDTGEPMEWVTDEDGTKHCEKARWSASVRTNATPWQIDLWRRDKGGQMTERKGILALQDDTLRLRVGKPGAERPVSFEDLEAGGGSPATIIARRAKVRGGIEQRDIAEDVVYRSRSTVNKEDRFQLRVARTGKTYFAKTGDTLAGFTILQYDGQADRIQIRDDEKGTTRWVERQKPQPGQTPRGDQQPASASPHP